MGEKQILKTRASTTALAGVLWAVMASYSGPAFAQDAGAASAEDASSASAFGDIVVTARRKEEALQSVPVAVTALNQEELDRRGSISIIDLQQDTPGLTFTNNPASRADISPTIRGQSAIFGGRYPAVITYFNEVPVLKMARGQFYDLESVQVLRGPQGTLFGRVTDGGNILLTARRPSDEFEGYVEGRAGDYDLRGVTGAINVPLIEDVLSARVAFESSRRDGYTENVNPDVANHSRDLDDVHYDSGRLSVLFTPSDSFENLLVYSFNQADENGAGSVIIAADPSKFAFFPGGGFDAVVAAAFADQQTRGPRRTSVGDISLGEDGGLYNERQDSYVVNTTTWRISDNLQVKNILGYVRIKNHYGSDYDGSRALIISAAGPFAAPEHNLEQYSEELQLQGSIGENFDFTLGTYWDYMENSRHSENDIVGLGGALYNAQEQYQQTRSRAVYGQVSYDLSDVVDGLSVDLGARYTVDHVSSSNANVLDFGFDGFDAYPHAICPDDPTCVLITGNSNAFTWTAGLNYQVSDALFLYGKISRGYRPGGVNSSAPVGSPVALYQPEYDTSHELGMKTDYELGPVQFRTNIAAFWDRYEDIQKSVFISLGETAVTNGSEAEIYGVELDQSIMPVRGLDISIAYAYTEPKYDQPATVAVDCAAEGLVFCALNRFAGVPKQSVTLGVHYTLPLSDDVGEITFGGSYYHRTSMAMSDNSNFEPTAIAPAMDLVNLDASWLRVMGSTVDLRFFMTNATDEEYYTGLNASLNSRGVTSATYGEPRMWGVGLRYNFGATN